MRESENGAIRPPKILILSCSTGEGHNSAAFAVAAALTAAHATCEVRDVLCYQSEKTARRISRVYTGMIRHIPRFFGFVYTLGKVYDELHLPSPLYAHGFAMADPLAQAIADGAYDAVVCTHLFAMEAMTAARLEDACSLPCFGVMTDYTIHPFVKDTALDGYFVPNARVAGQFFRKRFAPEKVFVTGIPTHPKFRADMTKEQARAALGVPQDKKLIVVMTGGAGCGHLKRLCKKILRAFDESHLFAVLTGRNDGLRAALDAEFGGSPILRTVPFTPDVHLWLRAADVAVSKAGGLSSTEIAVANVPLVHLKAIPGVESANFRWFSKNGMALRSASCGRAVARIKALLADPALARHVRDAQRVGVDPLASASVADIVLRAVSAHEAGAEVRQAQGEVTEPAAQAIACEGGAE